MYAGCCVIISSAPAKGCNASTVQLGYSIVKGMDIIHASCLRVLALPRRFADLMDLSKDRSRLDFFLKKARTVPTAALDAASNDSLSAARLGRADTAPAASAAGRVEAHMGDASAWCSESRGQVKEEPEADPAPDNEEALYWQQHGQIEEEEDEAGCGEGWEHGGTDDLDHLDATWHSTPGHDATRDEGEPPGWPSTEQKGAASGAALPKAEPELWPCDFTGRERSHEAGVKREPLHLHGSAAGCKSEQMSGTAASLRRFSYIGSPVATEEKPADKRASHGTHDDSRDSKVLVHLGLDSPKAQLPSSMAAASCAAALRSGECPGASRLAASAQCHQLQEGLQGSAPPQALKQQERAHVAASFHRRGCQREHPGASDLLQQSSYCIKDEGDAKSEPGCVGGGAAARACPGSHQQTCAMKQEQEHLPGVSSPESWATAAGGSQDTQGQEMQPQEDCISLGSPHHCPGRAQASRHACPVVDICSPELPARKQPAGAPKSPGLSESIDLSAVDLAEQQRILRMIAASRSLQEDLAASRACMQVQALSAQAFPQPSQKRRSQAFASQAQTAAAPGGSVKRRQLGIGAFLLTQQRSEGV